MLSKISPLLRMTTACVVAGVFLRCTHSGIVEYRTPPDYSSALTIFHINDTHSHLDASVQKLVCHDTVYRMSSGGFPALSAILRFRKKQIGGDALFLHGGDVFSGSLFFVAFEGIADAHLLNMMELDAMVVGNHEFDRGPFRLARFADTLHAPLLCANCQSHPDSILDKKIVPYLIKTVGAHRVGIIGITLETIPVISSPGEGVHFSDPFETCKLYVDTLTRGGITKIIVLSHLGYDRDQVLAQAVAGIDVIVGGHQHALLGPFEKCGMSVDGPYPTVHTRAQGEKTLIVQAGEYGRILGELTVYFDSLGNVNAWNGDPRLVLDSSDFYGADGPAYASAVWDTTIPIRAVPPDPAILTVLTSYKKVIDSLASLSLGYAECFLPNTRDPLARHSLSADTLVPGSAIGGHVARSMYHALHARGLRCDMALTNAGGVRIPIDSGIVSARDVYQLLPFQNTLVVCTLTGAEFASQMTQVIDRFLSTGSAAGFPLMHRCRIFAEVGDSGITSLRCEVFREGLWMELLADDTCRVVTNSFLAGGGDDYRIFKSVSRKYDTGMYDADAFMLYLAHEKTLPYPRMDPVVLNR